MKKVNLKVTLQNNDNRGSVFSGDYNKREVFLIAEIKKGHGRGGHYHNKIVHHHVLIGKIVYKEIPLTKNGAKKKNYKEMKKILNAGDVVKTPAHAAHLLIALQDSIIFESSDEHKKTHNYQPYRERIKIESTPKSN
ncbi:MAG: hypothetical protein ACW9W4_02095 [Candidatus Nitrosopumilus sp. bin_7KS]